MKSCANCKHLQKQNGNYACLAYVNELNEQLLSKHTLEVKVLTKSKPHYCEEWEAKDDEPQTI